MTATRPHSDAQPVSAPEPSGSTTPPAEAVEAALSRHSHWGLSSSDQKPIQCICGQLLGSTSDWRHHQAAAVVAALRLPERDQEVRRDTFAETSRAMNRMADIWEQDGSDPCRVRITREYANAYRLYADGWGEPTGSRQGRQSHD